MQSVLSQEWAEIEYIVVDPGSTDNTADVIREFQAKYPGRIVHVICGLRVDHPLERTGP